MNAHPGWSCGRRSETGASALTTGIDSPVKTPSSHSSSSTRNKRRSAGTMPPIRSNTTSPGTSSVTGTRLNCPSRRTSASCRICARSASIACSARYSLKNPKPTLRATITAMINALVAPPVNADTNAAPNSSTRIGFRIWRNSTAPARTRCTPSAFGPNRANRFAASADESPSRPLPMRESTSSGERPAASTKPRSVAESGPCRAVTARPLKNQRGVRSFGVDGASGRSQRK